MTDKEPRHTDPACRCRALAGPRRAIGCPRHDGGRPGGPLVSSRLAQRAQRGEKAAPGNLASC